MKVRVITDSASDLLPPHRPEVTVLPMCLAWMKKDSERAKTILAKRERDNCEMLVVLVREILAAEVPRPS